MTYKGNIVAYNNLNEDLKLKIDKTADINAIKTKVDNSWQKGVYNDTAITNLGNSSTSKAFRFNDWDADNSKLDSLYINIPVGRAFSGLIKLTLTSDYIVENAMGGTEIVYNVAKVEDVVFLNTMSINYISPDFAKCFYIKPLVSEASRLYIPITKAPNTRNDINIKIEIFSMNAIFDTVNAITINRDSDISQSHPWTPQTTSFMQKNQDNTISGSITSQSTFPFILKPYGQRAHMFHKDANGNLFIAPTAENGNAEWSLGAVFALDGTVHMPKLIVDGVDLKQSVSNGKAQVASAITGKGVQTASDATFETMANNINAIQTIGGAKGNGTSYMSDSSTIFSVSGLSFGPRVINIYSSNGGARIIYNPMVSHIADTFAFDTNNYRWHNYGGTNVQLLPNGFIATATAPNLLGSYYWEAFK
ncbi:hypothetical protein ABFY60_06680 [Lysinibacillus pakistanensis]|uniref:hypothetical protein n=1 Tax=Lysinibacillus pakistanensis TaxID=759811 RepID=UPI003D281232